MELESCAGNVWLLVKRGEAQEQSENPREGIEDISSPPFDRERGDSVTPKIALAVATAIAKETRLRVHLAWPVGAGERRRNVGFRVASIPEPGSAPLMLLGLLPWAAEVLAVKVQSPACVVDGSQSCLALLRAGR